MLVGDCECEEWWVVCPPKLELVDKFGLRAGLEAVVAARRRGLTALAEGTGWGVDEKDAFGVMDPVPLGVARFDGSSLMNMVAELGDTKYRLLRVWISASLNPLTLLPEPQMINASQASCLFEISSTDRIVRYTVSAIISR